LLRRKLLLNGAGSGAGPEGTPSSGVDPGSGMDAGSGLDMDTGPVV